MNGLAWVAVVLWFALVPAMAFAISSADGKLADKILLATVLALAWTVLTLLFEEQT